MGALMSGLSAVRYSAEGHPTWSVCSLLLAAVLDGLDGHVARYLDACTKIGFELDSLCDLANFGVSPSLVMFFWAKGLPGEDCKSDSCNLEHGVLWAACCIYTGCCAYRLARFNVAGHAEEMDKQHMKSQIGSPRPTVPQSVQHNIRRRKMYFRGIPAPVAAAYAMAPMILRLSNMPSLIGSVGEVGAWAIGRRGTALCMLLTGGLMVSPLPTLSSKMLKTDRDDSHLRSRSMISSLIKGFVFSQICVAAWKFPFELVLSMDLGHLLSIPIGIVIYSCFAADEFARKSE
eukprot:gnl/MRDRNA2_/MRDRNA2_139123_c0_seq1.p1 gnl/MRDRNA2_/MRDRNA2_139123_c0~~gnl/MRDRNA2_/MRDRNA2_139123_c0_seq1.p1  ORF type:complete len:336 (+),score=39.17 gnl/MRDRNA2_/MRDRNA2_139123_c0_seq1:142-1008(+)